MKRVHVEFNYNSIQLIRNVRSVVKYDLYIEVITKDHVQYTIPYRNINFLHVSEETDKQTEDDE